MYNSTNATVHKQSPSSFENRSMNMIKKNVSSISRAGMTVFLNLNVPFNSCGCITWKAQVQLRSQGPVLLGPRRREKERRTLGASLSQRI